MPHSSLGMRSVPVTDPLPGRVGTTGDACYAVAKKPDEVPPVRLAPVLRGGTTPRGGLAGGSRSATRRGRDSCDFMGKRALWVKRRIRTPYDRRPSSDMWRGESEVGTAAGRGSRVDLASTRRARSPTKRNSHAG